MKLPNYVAGQCREGAGDGEALIDPVTGVEYEFHLRAWTSRRLWTLRALNVDLHSGNFRIENARNCWPKSPRL